MPRRWSAGCEEIFDEIDEAMTNGVRFLVLSDRDSDFDHAPIPSLLLTSAVHHHLVRQQDPHSGLADRGGR